MLLPREATKAKNLPSVPPVAQPDQERRQERSPAFLAGLFAHPLALPRHTPENNLPGVESANSSTEIPRTIQVSVVISMPTLHHKKLAAAEEEFPNVAIGFARLPVANE